MYLSEVVSTSQDVVGHAVEPVAVGIAELVGLSVRTKIRGDDGQVVWLPPLDHAQRLIPVAAEAVQEHSSSRWARGYVSRRMRAGRSPGGCSIGQQLREAAEERVPTWAVRLRWRPDDERDPVR